MACDVDKAATTEHHDRFHGWAARLVPASLRGGPCSALGRQMFGKLDLELMPLTAPFLDIWDLKTKQNNLLYSSHNQHGYQRLASTLQLRRPHACSYQNASITAFMTPEPWHRDLPVSRNASIQIGPATHGKPLLPKRRCSQASFSRHLGVLGRRQEQAFSDNSG